MGVANNSPAMKANITIGDQYFMINNVSIYNQRQFMHAFRSIKPGEKIVLRGISKEHINKTVVVIAGNKSNKGYLGIFVDFNYAHENNILLQLFGLIINIFYWTAVISLGLGLANLLPISILDGGRIFKAMTEKKKYGRTAYIAISWIVGVLLLLNLILPIVL